MNKLIVVGLLLVSGGAFSNPYDSYQQDAYNQQMLEQQREQTRIMQSQAANDYNAQADQRMHNENMDRARFYGHY